MKKTGLTENLNEKQIEAIKEVDMPVRIIAGAGSGKTSVITGKILYLIQKYNFKLNEILALTFTKKAANEMKERIFNNSDLDPKQESYILTFHSLCYRILKKYYNKVGLDRNFDVVDSYYQTKVISSFIDTDREKPLTIKSMISKIKNSNFKTKNIEKHISFISGFSAESIDKYNLYQEILLKNNKLDYDDLMLYTYKLLSENPEVRKNYVNIFKYILVDEFQDTNNLQWSITLFLLDNRNCITIVGDPDQTIYTWRGARQELILNFNEIFKNSKTVVLDVNYRSKKPIVDIANLLIKNNKFRYEKELKPIGSGGEDVNIQGFIDIESQSKYIADQIFRLVNEKKYKYKDIFVLTRTNRAVLNIELAFNSLNIPFSIKGSNSFFSYSVISDSINFIRSYIYEDDISILNLLESLPKVGPVTVLKIRENALKEELPVFKYLQLNKNKYKKIIIDCIDYIVETKKDENKNVKMRDLLFNYLNDFGVLEKYKYFSDERTSDADRIDNFLEILEEQDINYSFLPFIDRIENFLSDVTIDSDSELQSEKDIDNVLISTIHGVKGLENKVVFIFNLNSYTFPNDYNKDPVYLEEERRTFYVAITRAKEVLTITYDSNKISDFITEISNVYKNNISKYRNYDYEIKKINQSVDEVNEKLNNLSIKIGTRINHVIYKEGLVIDVIGNQLRVNFEDKNLGIRLVPILSGVWNKI